MPTYEYECKSCAYTFEAFQSMSDEPLKDCPRCGREVRRLIHGGTGVIFKGAGFYVTDKSKSRDGTPAQGGKAGTVAADTAASGGAAASPPDGAAKQEKSPSGEGAKTAAQPAGEKSPAGAAAHNA